MTKHEAESIIDATCEVLIKFSAAAAAWMLLLAVLAVVFSL